MDILDEKKLGKNIKDLRERSNLTQEELGEIIGLTGGTVSNYENSISKPKIDILERFASFFRVPVDSLVRGDFSKWNDIPKTSLEKLYNTIWTLFPCFLEEESNNNTFNKAIEWHKKILENQAFASLDSFAFSACKTLYDEAEQADNVYASVNLLSLYIFIGSQLCNNQPLLEEKLEKLETEPFHLFEITGLQDCSPLSPQEEEKRKKTKQEYLRSAWIEILARIVRLKESSDIKIRHLGDYYLSVLFLLNLVDNNEIPEINVKVGGHILAVLNLLENPYAEKFYNTFFQEE